MNHRALSRCCISRDFTRFENWPELCYVGVSYFYNTYSQYGMYPDVKTSYSLIGNKVKLLSSSLVWRFHSCNHYSVGT